LTWTVALTKSDGVWRSHVQRHELTPSLAQQRIPERESPHRF
jgi:hypothetical protein